jgi:hypothetical protein
MIQPFEHGGQWLLVHGVQRMNTEQIITGELDDPYPPIKTFLGCWTPKGDWASTATFGMKFKTREEAESYLQAHRTGMEAALKALTR